VTAGSTVITAAVPADWALRIRSLRGRLGLTQGQLADLLGVSLVSVNRWENDQSTPGRLAWRHIELLERRGSLPTALREAQESGGEVAPPVDFSADPETVRLVGEAERLTYGHLFNPAFATETSLIDPLPHQRIAVYEHMVPQPCLRFLLADDAGAGKTIMAGLYVREMLARRLIRRVLVVPPAGLVGNWESELRKLFSLDFRIVSGADCRAGNPFAGPDGDRVIVSVDTLSRPAPFGRLQEAGVSPYDLVVFDEAHKLSADREPDLTIRRTDRYRLAEALAGARTRDARWSLPWSCHHLLLLTATPHMGKSYPYYALWHLLEPEALSTYDAFLAFPPDARKRHFLRRTKEEMVTLEGARIYPTRVSDTLSYELQQGESSEQVLYDETTEYIRYYYNRARMLNRSAARLAMSVFQRRLASSTWALLCSFERRLRKLGALIDDVRTGRMSAEELQRLQQAQVRDPFDEKTGDEEEAEHDREENEVGEDRALAGVVATSLAELEAERVQVRGLLDLARRVEESGETSKFDKLREVVTDAKYRDEKVLIFTEHRDTLNFLVRRLEGIGYAGEVAQIHGGMDYREREYQMEFFRKSAEEGGARYLVATDAAGEGINLQFCWLMINYDIPWNPARLEQRMGRVHRYKQKHDPVVIVNLVAGKTREGRVLKTLLDKLEKVRRALGSDKVFDVVGRLFEGVSLRDYMEQAVTEQGADAACARIEGTLTKEQVAALEERERRLFGDGGDVKARLPEQKATLEREELRRLLPGYVRRFVEKAASRLDLGVDGDLDRICSFRPLTASALDFLWPVLERYPASRQHRLTVYRPDADEEAVFLRPGEPLFDHLRGWVASRFSSDALRGAVFVDPYADRPYLFHLATVAIVRQADPGREALGNEEVLESRLVGLKQAESGDVEQAPVEALLLLRGAGARDGAISGSDRAIVAARFASRAKELRDRAQMFVVERIAQPASAAHRAALEAALPERLDFVARGFRYQDAELAGARVRLADRARAGDGRAAAELARVKERQRALALRRQEALARLEGEPELVAPGEVRFIAHALVVPSDEPADRERYDAEVEAIAMRVARAHEEARGATVKDVSTAELARAAGLTDHPGFDLLSRHASGEERAIEVKGRARVGDVEVSENEWAKACNERGRYWLYVVFNCGAAQPQLVGVRDPFGKLLATPRGGVIIDERQVLRAAEPA
jgi:superfamily II DNA or RNA helicase/DNA-binding XRE family transcriptional regulator